MLIRGVVVESDRGNVSVTFKLLWKMDLIDQLHVNSVDNNSNENKSNKTAVGARMRIFL